LQLVGAAKPPQLLVEALDRYEGARDRAKLAVSEWKKAGSPIIVTHSNGTVGLHPSFRAVEVAERHAERMRAGAHAQQRGLWRIPTVQPGRSEPLTERSPAAELRALKGGRS
jgi:hypothetical protein